MPARRPRPVSDWWRDAEGTPIPEQELGPLRWAAVEAGKPLFSGQCRVEQVAVSKEHGVLPSRLHQHGHVVRRGHNRRSVRFDRDDQLISLRPHLVRVLTTSGGC